MSIRYMFEKQYVSPNIIISQGKKQIKFCLPIQLTSIESWIVSDGCDCSSNCI